jgi:HNH endonuclease
MATLSPKQQAHLARLHAMLRDPEWQARRPPPSEAHRAALKRLHAQTRLRWQDPAWRARQFKQRWNNRAWRARHMPRLLEQLAMGPQAKAQASPSTIDQLLDRYVFMDPTSGCWIWVGPRNPNGYGYLSAGFRQYPSRRLAHRVLYEVIVGRLWPERPELHHRCGRTWCVNPDHLRPINKSDHARFHLFRPGHHRKREVSSEWSDEPEPEWSDEPESPPPTDVTTQDDESISAWPCACGQPTCEFCN